MDVLDKIRKTQTTRFEFSALKTPCEKLPGISPPVQPGGIAEPADIIQIAVESCNQGSNWSNTPLGKWAVTLNAEKQ